MCSTVVGVKVCKVGGMDCGCHIHKSQSISPT